MPSITLRTLDQVNFVVQVDVLKCSGTIATMFEVLEPTEKDAEVIPLQLESNILKLILDWTSHRQQETVAGSAAQGASAVEICEWEEKFLHGLGMETFFQLIIAANYLDIKVLSQILHRVVANMISGKSPEVIRGNLKLPTTKAVGGGQEQVRDDVRSGPFVKVQSSEGVEKVVALSVAESIPTIKKMMKTAHAKQGNGQVVKLRDVNYETLLNVITWVSQQKTDSSTNDDNETKADNGSWDETFLNDLENPALLELLLAAKSLNIERLVDLTCKKVESMLMGKSEEAIRETMGVRDDDKEKEKDRNHADWIVRWS